MTDKTNAEPPDPTLEYGVVVDLVVGILRGLAKDEPPGIMARMATEPASQHRVQESALALADELAERLPPWLRDAC